MSKLRVVLAALEGLHADVVDIGLEMSQNFDLGCFIVKVLFEMAADKTALVFSKQSGHFDSSIYI